MSNEDSDSDSEEDFVDPSLQRARDMKKFTDEPIRIPGGDILTAEPQATMMLSNLLGMVIKRLQDPALTTSIMDNVSKSLELSLENKQNKINYLKNDEGFKKKNNSFMIDSIHNNTSSTQPTIDSDEKDKKDEKEDNNEKDKENQPEQIQDAIKDKKENQPEQIQNDSNNAIKDKKENQPEQIQDDKKENQPEQIQNAIKIKGGHLPFFTEQECSFF
jgi:hypothetical protein